MNVASILTGTNKLISSSRIDWSHIKCGSLFRFSDDDIFYTITSSDKIFSVKNFDTLNQFTIKIKLNDDNSWIQIMPDDEVTISYKEYELSILLGIDNPGKGYKVNDLVTIEGGTPSFSISDGILNTSLLKVMETDKQGGIKKISPVRKGKYFTPPKEKSSLISETGNDAVLEIDYSVIENKSKFETEISNVTNMGDHLIVTLKRPLPQNLSNGKISIEKYEVNLKEIYNGPNRINSLFNVSNDTTPNYKFPYMMKASQRPDTAFNYFLNQIDPILFDLNKRIKELENKTNN